MSTSQAKATTLLQAAATLDAAPRKAREPFWPAAVVVFGISLTAAWSILLGYGLIKLIRLAI
jgi:hypothetical protein